VDKLQKSTEKSPRIECNRIREASGDVEVEPKLGTVFWWHSRGGSVYGTPFCGYFDIVGL
jgi:hypothetical protein